LKNEGFSEDEIYRRIGDDNNYKDVQEKYNHAKENSKFIILKLREKIKNEIKSI